MWNPLSFHSVPRSHGPNAVISVTGHLYCRPTIIGHKLTTQLLPLTMALFFIRSKLSKNLSPIRHHPLYWWLPSHPPAAVALASNVPKAAFLVNSNRLLSLSPLPSPMRPIQKPKPPTPTPSRPQQRCRPRCLRPFWSEIIKMKDCLRSPWSSCQLNTYVKLK